MENKLKVEKSRTGGRIFLMESDGNGGDESLATIINRDDQSEDKAEYLAKAYNNYKALKEDNERLLAALKRVINDLPFQPTQDAYDQIAEALTLHNNNS